MRAQLSFLDTDPVPPWERFRRSDPSTSRDAARKNHDGLTKQQALIAEALKTLGPEGGSCYDVGDRAEIGHVAAARRLSELGRLKVAAVIGRKATPNGQDTARIWRHRDCSRGPR